MIAQLTLLLLVYLHVCIAGKCSIHDLSRSRQLTGGCTGFAGSNGTEACGLEGEMALATWVDEDQDANLAMGLGPSRPSPSIEGSAAQPADIAMS